MKAYTLLLVSLTICNNLLWATNLKSDTLSFSDESLIINLPRYDKVFIQKYEEGYFKTYFYAEDSIIFTIHCGTMVNLPIINYPSYHEKTIISNGKIKKIERRWKISDTKKGKRYYREDDYLRDYFHLMYENVPRKRRKEFDAVIDNITIILDD